MSAYYFDQSLIWHVVFHPGRCLWSRRWRHVSLAGFANDTWLHLDLNRGGVSVAAIYHYDEVTDYLSFLLHHYTVVKFGPSLGRSRSFLRPMSCVAFTQHVLGLPRGALLPDGLFATLTSDYGAEVVKGEGQNSRRNDGAAATARSG